MEILQQYEPILAIAIGVFLCLFGYRIKKVAFVVIWFLIGYYLMSLVVGNITQDPIWQQILPLGAGLLLGVLGFSIEKFCIFAVATFTVSTTLIDLFQMSEPIPIAFAVAAGVIVGCIAVAFIKPLGIVTTALSGAKLIAKYTVSSLALNHEPYFLIILAACFVIGCLYQFKSNRHIG